MQPKPSKRYLLYAIELHESIIRVTDVPDIQDEHRRAIERLKERLEKGYPSAEKDRENDRRGQDG